MSYAARSAVPILVRSSDTLSPRARGRVARSDEILIGAVIGTDSDRIGITEDEFPPSYVAVFKQKVSPRRNIPVSPMSRGGIGLAIKGIIHPSAALSLDNIRHDGRVPVWARDLFSVKPFSEF